MENKILTREEEATLFHLWQNEHDEEARDLLVRCNQGLVRSIARSFYGYGVEMDDLISEGNLGLLTAIDKFDSSMGNKFSTYAVEWIRQKMQRYINEGKNTVSLPVHVAEKVNKINRFKSKYFTDNGCEPTTEEIADGTNMTVEEVNKAVKAYISCVSLQTSVGEDEDELGEFLADENSSFEQDVEMAEFNQLVSEAMDKVLNAKEKKAIEMRLGLNGSAEHNYPQIGEALGITPQGAKQLIDRAFKKLRKIL